MSGRCFKYGDNVNTDVIIPARYLSQSRPEQLAAHCMQDIDADFAGSVRPGDVIVGGMNFGCGSSREHAPLAIKACGVSCVIAAGFARIFYRNCINIGLPIMECPDAAEGINSGDTVEADPKTGLIKDLTTGESWTAQPFPDFISNIIAGGGLLNSIAGGR